MDEATLRAKARAALSPEGQNLIRVGEELIAEAKELMKAAEAAIHSSRLLAIEAQQTRAEIARRRGENRPVTSTSRARRAR